MFVTRLGQTMGGSTSKGHGSTQIADLRAGLGMGKGGQVSIDKPPPKPKKQAKRETADDRAEKAERQAMVQHTTSLLKGGNSKKPYVRVGERPVKSGSLLGFLFQLILVLIVAGGVAYAIDPTLVPEEWKTKIIEQIKTWMPAS